MTIKEKIAQEVADEFTDADGYSAFDRFNERMAQLYVYRTSHTTWLDGVWSRESLISYTAQVGMIHGLDEDAVLSYLTEYFKGWTATEVKLFITSGRICGSMTTWQWLSSDAVRRAVRRAGMEIVLALR